MILRPIPGAPEYASIPQFPSTESHPAQHDLLSETEDLWLKRLDDGYPPPRRVYTVQIDPRPRRGPTERLVMESAENDPVVIRFLTDILGPMVSVDTADRLFRARVTGYYSAHHGEITDKVRAAYGVKICVWAPADETWTLLFQGDAIELHCKRQPSADDLRKLIFVLGWWELRTNSYNTHGGWRRLALTNHGELMRKGA